MGRRKKASPQCHQETIASAAQGLFSKQGFEQTSMNEIALASGYSKATLYVYFENKDAIIAFLVLESIKKLECYIRTALLQQSDTKARYYAICDSLLQYQKEYPEYFQMALQEIQLPDEEHEKQSTQIETYQVGEAINQIIIQFLKDGIDAHDLRSDLAILPTIFSFWGMLSGFINIASNKQMYIEQAMQISNQEFLSYGFSLLYRSIALEEK